ncbi:MAG: hypothetical protein ABFS17_09655 [Chloroflexota bacterium]
MMSSAMIDDIVRFLEQQEEQLPPRVTNGMLLIAIREERQARQREIGELVKGLAPIVKVLDGEKPDRSDGLVAQVKQLRQFRSILLWLVTAVTVSFLGGMGMYLFEGLFR